MEIIEENNSERNPYRDPSLWSLLFVNVLVIFFAVKENWNLSSIILIYWLQGGVIGFFVLLSIGKKIRDYFIFIAFFFIAYISYLMIILIPLSDSYGNPAGWKNVFLMVLVFFFNHLFSFWFNKKSKLVANNLFSSFVIRIFIMHLMIILGSFVFIFTSRMIFSLIFFLFLKTLFDAWMHIKGHKAEGTDNIS